MSVALVKSSSVVGGMTLISRFLGFARDMLLAILFGASASMDAFLVAFKIPNFMRRLFAEGAFAQSFVPVLAATKQEASHEDVRQLVAEVSGTLAGVLTLLTIVGVVAAPALIFLFAPGFADEPSKFELAAGMLRITFPYLLFIALTALAASVLNTYGKFALPAVAPALLNISLIACALWLAPHLEQPIIALAIGVFIAGVAQLLVLMPAVARLGLLPRPRWGWASERVRRIMRLMLPIIFGSSVAQVALLLDTILASLLISGSVSWLYYADRLMEFPLGIFSIAIATVILPGLSRHHAAKDEQAFSRTLDWALQLILLVCLPSAVGLFLLAGPVLTTLFQYAAFTPHDVVMSGYSLMAYAFGLLGFSLVKIAAPAYFSRQDTKTPVIIGIKALLIGMSFNLVGVLLALHLEWEAPHLVLAIGTSLGAFVNAGLLLRGLKKSGVYRSESPWLKICGRYFTASTLMAVVLYVLSPEQRWWFEAGAMERATQLLGIILAGVVTYFLALLVLGLRPTHLSGAH